ncbi:MAG TPA: hypothetical protein VK066_03820 [Chloroflexota bacterium]|nr:hypothetical protein [Chloroflexota bacterium]
MANGPIDNRTTRRLLSGLSHAANTHEAVLAVLPLGEPLAYDAAHHALMGEMLARVDTNCLTYELDGGLASLLVYRVLAARALETAIRRGELTLLG